MKIPVFHDDQHGTAIIVGAAVLNALELTGKRIENVKHRDVRAPARRRSPASICSSSSAPGARTSSSPTSRASSTRAAPLDGRRKALYAQDTNARTLADVIGGADIFLGLSAGGVLKPEMVKHMAAAPAHHGARQSDARDHARGRHRRRAPTP